MSKRLILLRHAKSDWDSGAASDHDRPLARRGLNDAPRVGLWMAANQGQPDQVLCSTALRARQTLEGVIEQAGWKGEAIEFLPDLYMADGGSIVDLAAHYLTESEVVLMVGHNPGMDDALLRFCPDAPRTADSKLMTTASFAIIDFPGRELKKPVLTHFLRPREL